MFNTTSSEYTKLERLMRASVEQAREQSDAPLVVVIHPKVEKYIRMQTGLHTLKDAEMGGIAGCRNIMLTESAPGFRVIICNENL